MNEAAHVLVVEDEPNLRSLIADLLGLAGHAVTLVGSVAEAEAEVARKIPDLALLDVKLPDGDGIALAAEWRARGLGVTTLVMTAFGTVERAVLALRAGAHDFLVKPFDNDRLKVAVAAALEARRSLSEVELEAGTVDDRSDAARAIVGAAGGLRDVVVVLPRIAESEATVLILGESGTGKELVAKAIHRASPRKDGPFVSLNCAAIAPTLVESELFGFERGAFTGAHAQKKGFVEAADGGTLFLDEIGDMPLEAQSRLLRVLQEREVTRVGGRAPVKVDVRVIGATHRDLLAEVAGGRFRRDLLYRLDVLQIRLPRLAERAQDIPGLVEHFLLKHSRRHKVPAPTLPASAMAELRRYAWPGNVRELENVIERAVVLGRFDPSWLDPRGSAPAAPAVAPREPPPDPSGEVQTLKEAVAEAERRAVVAALRRSGGNKAEAARMLGISYKTLFNKINEHQIREQRGIE